MYRQRSLLKRPVYPEDIAEAVYYFASDLPVKSTGNILNVDAGKRLASRGSRTLEGARRSFRPRRAGAQRAFRQGPQLYPSNMFDSSFVHNREEAAGRRTMVKGFGRRPFCGRWYRRWGRRSKASQGGNRGEVGGPFGERDYGDLRIADRWRAGRRQPSISVFSSEAATAAVSDGDDAREPSVRIGRGKTGDRVRTLRSCSGVRLEAKAIGAVKRDAWRRS
jgi:hypothetical protein